MCSHFNIEDGRKYATFPAYYALLFQKGKNATGTHTEKICAVCGEGPVTDRMCQKWFAKFHAGDFLLDDAPRSGKIDQLKLIAINFRTLMENNQCYITWEISDILRISKSIKLLVKMKNVSFILRKN